MYPVKENNVWRNVRMHEIRVCVHVIHNLMPKYIAASNYIVFITLQIYGVNYGDFYD